MKTLRSGSYVLALLVASALAAPSLEAARVYVRVGPPKVKVEVRGVAPSPGHVWVGGYHSWNGHAYVWVPGSWTVGPRPGAVWVAGHWKKTRHGWHWVDGHWR